MVRAAAAAIVISVLCCASAQAQWGTSWGRFSDARGTSVQYPREVFTVPGEILSALSAGTNTLLKLGATPLTSAADVLASFGLDAEAPRDRDGLLDLLPATHDELVRKTGLQSSEIAQALVELELAGSVAAFEGVYRLQ